MALPDSVKTVYSRFQINGKPYEANHEVRTTLWELLSERFGLPGTVKSCDRASCGACTVLVGGLPIYSCHILALDCQGKNVTTIEGIGDEEKPHIIQLLAHQYHAAQCGYCTSGWIVAAKAAFDEDRFGENELKEAISGHLCRCGCYPAIEKCLSNAAKLLTGKAQSADEVLGALPDHSRIVSQPLVRDWSTGGGHSPEPFLIEGDARVRTEKWQGYPPSDLNLVGKPIPPVPQISMPKVTGRAEYATRVVLPGMLYAVPLASPYPHARFRSIDTATALKMPGVKAIVTKNEAPTTIPLRDEVMYQGEIVALAVAESKDQAEDAVSAIKVEFDVLPSIGTVEQAMNPDSPKLRPGGNLLPLGKDNPARATDATARWRHGDVEAGFIQSDIIKEVVYHFRGASVIPLQPVSGVASWDGNSLTFWGMAQGSLPARKALSQWLEIPESKIRFIDRWNGGTFGTRTRLRPIDGLVAFAAKLTGRPVKYTLSLAEELSQVSVKPEVIIRYKVGLKGGRIVALKAETWQVAGDFEQAPMTGGPVDATARDQFILYGPNIPNWEFVGYCYKSNTPPVGSSRSNAQQEFKWAFECMMDEMAEASGIDPVEFRLRHVAKPGDRLSPVKDWDAALAGKIEEEAGTLRFDSYGSIEVISEGAKEFGWSSQGPESDDSSSRFKRGKGMAVSDHHAGNIGYRENEEGFATADPGAFESEIELFEDGLITVRSTLPENGTDHDTAMAQTLGELLGFTTTEKIRFDWGDSRNAPPTPAFVTTSGARSNTLQGGAALSAGQKLKEELLLAASGYLHLEKSELALRDGMICWIKDPSRSVSLAEIAKKAGGSIRTNGRVRTRGEGKGRALVRSVGACFVEVEVDTLTGAWRITRAVSAQDAGKVINPLLAESDMDGSFIQGVNTTSDMLPWDEEAPGNALASNGFLSYRLPTVFEMPDKIFHVFIESLEPRWFFGYKSFSETTIGAVPSAVTNAIYDAIGVRIRDHPITPDKILGGLRGRS